jgi:isoquinoline 1-oxidoreductase beta subunit
VFERGDVGPALQEGGLIKSSYSVAPAPSAPLETLTATARLALGHLEVWAPTQAPGLARAAAARAAGMSESDVTLYPMLIGGGYGRKMETQAIAQAAAMAVKLGKPVQLAYSRLEETLQDGLRAPAAGEISARVEAGMIAAWQVRIAAPDTGGEVAERIGEDAALAFHDDEAAAGAVPPYSIPSVAAELLPAKVGVRTGLWRSGAHSYTAFFTESFVDELARMGQFEPLSFRMQMLGDNPRLARCLSTAAALGGWDGGVSGSSLGLAGHSAFGSHIGLLVEIDIGADRKIRVLRAVAAVDCGRVVNPNLVRQQVEGGILFGIGAAIGAPLPIEGGRPAHGALGRLELPRLATSPEVTVEIVETDEPPGGMTELAVPPVAPAIANALHARTGERLRSLPLRLS